MRYEVKSLRTWYKTWKPAYKRIYTVSLWERVSNEDTSIMLKYYLYPLLAYTRQMKQEAIANLTVVNNPEAN